MNQPFLMAQVVVSILLITCILVQNKGAGLGTAFGGESSFYRSKRGVEKILYRATVVLFIIFVATTITNVVLK